MKRRNIDKYKTKKHSNYHIKRGMQDASLFLYIKFLQINSLEVVVNTESDIITVKRCTPNVICLSTTYVILSRLPSNETNVSFKTYLWTEVNCETWSQTCFPLINRSATSVSVVVMCLIPDLLHIILTFKIQNGK